LCPYPTRRSSDLAAVERTRDVSKARSIGVYDTTILCDACEPQFGDWDAYAQRLLTEPPSGNPHRHTDGSIVAWVIAEYDYAALRDENGAPSHDHTDNTERRPDVGVAPRDAHGKSRRTHRERPVRPPT